MLYLGLTFIKHFFKIVNVRASRTRNKGCKPTSGAETKVSTHKGTSRVRQIEKQNEGNEMIITAAYKQGEPIAPRSIDNDSVTVWQVGASQHQVRRGDESGQLLFTDTDIDLCWATAQILSDKLNA